ncbi:hypothetical protein [Trujillonella humicola]|uniref:hypothetical protein n=1 Tax=Trujillonella humicola TaxID=3383699 RepID=UPI003906BE3A
MPGDPSVPFPAFLQLLRLLDTDGEGNIPAWFSSALLLSIAAVSAGISSAAEPALSGGRWHWRVLAAIFAYLSMDELAQIHEETIPAVAELVPQEGVLTFGWVVIAAPLVLVFVLAYLPFLLRLPRRTALLLVAAGALYVGGALGMELVSGWIYSEGDGFASPAYVWATTVEELGEMAGATLCLATLLAVLRSAVPDGSGPAGPEPAQPEGGDPPGGPDAPVNGCSATGSHGPPR